MHVAANLVADPPDTPSIDSHSRITHKFTQIKRATTATTTATKKRSTKRKASDKQQYSITRALEKQQSDDCVERWNQYWKHYDVESGSGGGPAVALKELLEERRWLLPKGKCLVAGCGRGYDALYLAARGFDTLGIDVSKSAIDLATKAREDVPAGDAGHRLSSFAVQDFLTFRPGHQFTIAYDYGLFSAIHSSQRSRWAQQYQRLVCSQGTLIVLLYPLLQRSNPPPFRVSMAECEKFLKPFFVLTHVNPNCKCIEGQEGNEIMSVWKRI